MNTIPKNTLSNTMLRSSAEANGAYFPIYVVSAIMGGIFVLGTIAVPRGPHQGLIRCCIMLTSVSLWLFWLIIYIAQINPLLGPRLDNASLAWVGHCWGADPRTIGQRRDLAAPDSDLPQPPAAPPEPPPEF